MRATRATTALLATAMLCLGPAACGGDDDDRDGAARTTATTAAAGTGSGLGAERFEALEDVYIAQVAVDDLGDDAAADEFQLATEPLIEACNDLDADDPLLGPLRRVCPVLTRFAEQVHGLSTCAAESQAACDELIGDVRRTLRDFTRLSRRGDEAIRDAGLAPACQKALLTPGLAYEVIESFERAFELLDRGAREAANRALAAADAKAERLPDGNRSLARFRSGCR